MIQDSLRGNLAYNFDNEIELIDENEAVISEEGEQILLEQNSWIQFLNEDGYVVGAFNEPTYVSDHYSPVEIAHLNIYADNNQDYVFYTGKVNENLSFLMALPSKKLA